MRKETLAHKPAGNQAYKEADVHKNKALELYKVRGVVEYARSSLCPASSEPQLHAPFIPQARAMRAWIVAFEPRTRAALPSRLCIILQL